MSRKKKSGGYLVLKRIWHSADERYYDPGAEVSLDHLNEQQISRLLTQGTVAIAPEVEEKEIASSEEVA